jgi:hypothetical protein
MCEDLLANSAISVEILEYFLDVSEAIFDMSVTFYNGPSNLDRLIRNWTG